MRVTKMDTRRVIFTIIQPDNGDSLSSRIFDRIITLLILASVVMVFAVTLNIPPAWQSCFKVFEGFVSIVFTLEYLLRLWTSDLLYSRLSRRAALLRYAFSPIAIIDLLAFLPFWLPMVLPGSLLGIRILRLVRLFRIFKLNRYCDAMASIAAVIHDKRRELLGSTFFVFLLMLISSLLMYTVEHEAQPDVFKNAFSGLWWAVATLTTVGYGDIYPVTGTGRLIGAFIALSGVAFVAVPTGIVSSGMMERISGKETLPEEEDEQLAFCPHCGKRLHGSNCPKGK